MTSPPSQDPILQSLVRWAEEQPTIRAMLLTSTRAIPGAQLDRFSDYDVILAVSDIQPYFEDRQWLDTMGMVLVLYKDPLRTEHGFARFACITQYEDGTKIDYTLMETPLLQQYAAQEHLPDELDVGYRVLLDKDGLTRDLKPPTFRAHIPSPPSREEFLTLIEVFFHEATYVAKHLWRGQLLPAKYSFDCVMKQRKLRQMLEWRVEIDRDWSYRPGAYGKGLKENLDPELWERLKNTYVGAGTRENWRALFETIELFRHVAREVAEGLSYTYPEDLHRRALAYLHRIEGLPGGMDS
jgi:aminoglycoside 6-adenylyltransferase